MAAITMVVLLLAMGLILVSGLSEQLTGQGAGVALLRAATEGQSAALTLQNQAMQLNWGSEPLPEWQCRSLREPAGRACLQRLSDGRYLLGVELAFRKRAPVLWRWVRPADGKLNVQSAGWLDLCPTQAIRCRLL